MWHPLRHGILQGNVLERVPRKRLKSVAGGWVQTGGPWGAQLKLPITIHRSRGSRVGAPHHQVCVDYATGGKSRRFWNLNPYVEYF